MSPPLSRLRRNAWRARRAASCRWLASHGPTREPRSGGCQRERRNSCALDLTWLFRSTQSSYGFNVDDRGVWRVPRPGFRLSVRATFCSSAMRLCSRANSAAVGVSLFPRRTIGLALGPPLLANGVFPCFLGFLLSRLGILSFGFSHAFCGNRCLLRLTRGGRVDARRPSGAYRRFHSLPPFDQRVDPGSDRDQTKGRERDGDPACPDGAVPRRPLRGRRLLLSARNAIAWSKPGA